MNHSRWRTRLAKEFLGETVEYDQEYLDARLAGDLRCPDVRRAYPGRVWIWHEGPFASHNKQPPGR